MDACFKNKLNPYCEQNSLKYRVRNLFMNYMQFVDVFS